MKRYKSQNIILLENVIFFLKDKLIVGGRMKVVDLKVKDNNGDIVSMEKLKLEKLEGVLEEKASRGKNKQVSILSVEIRSHIDTGSINGLCTGRFYENITVSGLDASELSIGSKIEVGDTILEVTEVGKRCFNDCELVKEDRYCQLSDGAIFTRVLKEGKVRMNSNVKVIR